MHIKYLIFANSKYQEMQSWYLSDFFDFDFIYINIHLHIHMNSLPGEHKQECKIHESEVTKSGSLHAVLGIVQTRTLYKIRKCF